MVYVVDEHSIVKTKFYMHTKYNYQHNN